MNETISKSVIDGLILRDWQLDALKKWKEANYRGIAEVATAGGKSRFALECAAIWLGLNPLAKIVIIVPTTALQDQWVVLLQEVLRIEIADICVWPEGSDTSKKFHVMVANTARHATKRFTQKDNVFLIADECHRYASQENSKALSFIKAATLGITATAERQYDDGLNEILIPNLGLVIYKYGLLSASKDEILSRFELVNVQVPLTSEEEVEYNKLSRRLSIAISKGDSEAIKRIAMLRSSVSKSAKSRIPATIRLVELNPERRIIIFHEEIVSAEKINTRLRELKLSAVLYHSQMSPGIRRDNLKQFRKGISRILICIRALDEGIDVPEADMAIIAASTSSLRQRIQRMGRVVRKSPNKEIASVYTLFATENERQLLLNESTKISEVAKINWLKME